MASIGSLIVLRNLMRLFQDSPVKETASTDYTEQVLVIIRGDALAKKCLGLIISELEQQFSIIAFKTIKLTPSLVNKLYPAKIKPDFYPNLIEYSTTGFHIAVVIEGENAIHRMVQLKGKSPLTDTDDTLRKKYGTNNLISCVHCSDNAKAAAYEIKLFFKQSEIFKKIPDIQTYERISQPRGPE